MQPAFRSIFRCYLLSPFVTLSAGGVGPSFKSGCSKPRLYDQGKSDARRRVALRSRVSLAHFAMWTLRLITQGFGRPRSRAASGQSASRYSSTLGIAGSGDRLRHPSKDEMPMFRGDDLVGVFILYKLKVQPFTEKKIELVTTFADRRLLPPRARGCSMSFVSARP